MRMKTFAINVESNAYRRDRIVSQADKAGVDIQIFRAVTPKTMEGIPHDYQEQRARNFTGRGLMPTEIAAGLSHIQLWRQLQADHDADFYLILEDDIDVVHDIGRLIDSLQLPSLRGGIADEAIHTDYPDTSYGLLCRSAPRNDVFVKFSGQQQRPMKTIKTINDQFTLHRYAFGPLDAAAYLVNKSAAKKLEHYCQSLHAPIDILMDRSYDHGVPIYGVLPYAASTQFNFDKNDPLFTDIGVRDRKYAPDITRWEKTMVKLHRLAGSVKRHLATLRLYLVKTL